MNRIDSVDTVRFFAIISVIILHAGPFRQAGNESDIYRYIDVILNQISRFAVPFFFIISGYFWGNKINNGHSIAKVTGNFLRRVFIIFIAWSIIYILPYNLTALNEYGILGPVRVAYWNVFNLFSDPAALFFQGTKVHLWFLVSLMFSMIIAYIFICNKIENELIVISLLMYFFGILAKSYSNTPVGIHVDFNTRNGPFFSTIFFITGYFFSKQETKKYWYWYGFLILIFGCILHFSEIYILWKYFDTSPYQDYVVGTYFMGIGTSMMALSGHACITIPWLSCFGKYTLGIYAIHYIFIDIFKAIIMKMSFNPALEIGYVLIVAFFSTSVVCLASINKTLKKILT